MVSGAPNTLSVKLTAGELPWHMCSTCAAVHGWRAWGYTYYTYFWSSAAEPGAT